MGGGPGRLALAVVAGLSVIVGVAAAQERDTVGRPGILAATGLLQTEPLEMPETDSAPGLTMEVPTSPQVRAQAATETDDPSVIAAIQFVTEAGQIAESVVLTGAQISTGAEEDRRFALANLLVLRSFPALAATAQEAQLIAFGPVPDPASAASDDDGAPARPDAVQSLGTFVGEAGENLFFRHIGMVVPGREKGVIALVTINVDLMPVRGDADLADSYSGLLLDSLRFLPETVEGEAAE